MTTLQIINLAIMLAFFLCYSYQFFYIPVAWFKKDAPHREPSPHRIAVLIAARNEQSVIGNLIDSVKAQDYPTELVDVFVVADNCTDLTGSVAGAHGANVYFRNDQTQVGKGYALQYLLHCIEEDFAPYDGYLVLDADNVLSPNYITEINKTFSDGYQIVTSYRNSKNYGENWISAGYALWFIRESRYLNNSRMLMGTSCAISGTGFLFSRKVIESTNGWVFHLLTEDIEFSVYHILQGRTIGFCADAVLYDEQPATFRQSWRQRLRWARGFLQVFRKYGFGLIKGMGKGSFSCYDMSMTVMPAFLLTVALIVSYLVVGLSALGGGVGSEITFFQGLYYILQMLAGLYGVLFVVGLFTTITEWENIHTTPAKKVLYTITFPIFMLTYIPISLVALFSRKVQWKPIQHHRADRRVLEAAAAGTKRIQNQ